MQQVTERDQLTQSAQHAEADHLSELEQLDQDLFSLLAEEEIDSEILARILNERKDCLAKIAVLPGGPEKARWAVALERTERLFNEIKKHRNSIAARASQYIKGRKSVQIYRKFE